MFSLHKYPGKFVEHEPLSSHTSWRIGGPARYYLEVTHCDDVQTALGQAYEWDIPVLVLGGGTNVLVQDTGFPGLVVRYRTRNWHINADDNDPDQALLYAEAGAPMAGTARRVAQMGWSGLEWAEGVPGSIGGAIYGNAGCYGGDIASVLHRAWVLTHGIVQEWSVAQFAYGYRSSVLKQWQREQTLHRTEMAISAHPPLILAAELRCMRADVQELANKIARIAAERKSKTPWGSSCGSVFRNPTSTDGHVVPSAGRLIDQAGLKGQRIGAAEISHVHANYIVNLGGAKSDDVLQLIDLARTTVLKQFGIELELEIQIV